MNAPFSPIPLAVRDHIRSLVSLARYQQHRSLELRRWAAEAELEGKRDAAAKWSAQADRYRLDAVWHLHHAQSRKDAHRG